MRRARFFLPLLFTLSLSLGLALNAAEPDIILPGTDGMEHAPFKVAAEKKAVVIFFGSPFCNTSNTFLPEINAITEAFEDRFSFFFVHSEADLELTQVMEHQELLKVRPLALLDKKQLLVQHTGARTTPEVVVISREGKTLYQGRINDLYLGPTKRQRKATTSDLRDALNAIAADKPVATPRTQAVGCKIAGLK
jgi:thioredoxin-related protein